MEKYVLVLYVLILIGPVNCFLITGYFLVFKKLKPTVRPVILAVLLLSLESFREFLYVFGTFMELRTPVEKFFQFYLFVPALFTMTYVKLVDRWKKAYFLLFLPGAIGLIVIVLFANNLLPYRSWLNSYLPIIIDFVVLFWFYGVYKRYCSPQKTKSPLKYLGQIVMLIFLINGIASLIYSMVYLGWYGFPHTGAYLTFLFPTVLSLLVCVMAFSLLARISFFLHSKKNAQLPRPPAGATDIVGEIIHKELFLDPNLTLSKLAISYKMEQRDISNAIWLLKKKTYRQFINEQRLEYFLKLIREGAREKKTIFGIAQDAGFNSKATFNRVFKERFGTTPSKYIEKDMFT